MTCEQCGFNTCKCDDTPDLSSSDVMPGYADGTAKLCRILYNRKERPKDYLGGSDAKMLHDAADKILFLQSLFNLLPLEEREDLIQIKMNIDKKVGA